MKVPSTSLDKPIRPDGFDPNMKVVLSECIWHGAHVTDVFAGDEMYNSRQTAEKVVYIDAG